MVRDTSYSDSASGLAPTLIWILICGGFPWGCSEAGAFGFSNDRSLVYCARTLSWGGAPAVGGLPLPLVMKSLLAQNASFTGRVAIIALPPSTSRPQEGVALYSPLRKRPEGCLIVP